MILSKNKVLIGLLATTVAIGLLTGCGKKEPATAESTESLVEAVAESSEDTNSEDVVEEDTEVTTPFLDDLEKYDSIISTLTPDKYYAFAGIGEDYDVLLVTEGVYDNLDGNMAAIDAVVYGFGNDGEIYQAGSVWSDGTAYPLAVYENSIMFGGNHHMTMACVRDGSVIIQKEADETFDTQGNVTYSYNEGDIDDIREVEDDSILREMYEIYGKATVINFTPGEAEFEPDPGISDDIPSNDFEARVGKTKFESFDEIIGMLEGDEAYALVDVRGQDSEVLLVTSYCYDDLEGHLATTECTPYTVKSNGVCTADCPLHTGGTATPVKMDKDGNILTATHISLDKYCYGDNGTDDAAIMVLSTVSADELDDNGNPKAVYGFVRTKNSLIEDDMKNIDSNDIDTYKKLFAEYDKAEPISFTRIK